VGRQDQFLFWLSGQAGTGKSTIALTVAQQFSNERRLGASFFFSRGQGNRGNAKRFFTSLASQLADLSPDLRHLISEAIAKHHRIAEKQFGEQWNRLILEPLRQCQSHWSPIVVVIDALDECDSEDERGRKDERRREKDIKEILKLLMQLKDLVNIRLRIFITSRPEIRNSIEAPTAILRDVALYNVEDSEQDISRFLQNELAEIQKSRCPHSQGWPGQEKIRRLTEKAGKLFIYAATACRFIDVKILYDRHLSKILEDNTAGMEDLYEIYTRILEQSVPDVPEDEKIRFCVSLRSIIGTIAVLFSPLSVDALHKLLPSKIKAKLDATVDEYLSGLRSILDVPDDRDLPVCLSHLSFRDFLLNEEKCEKQFWVSEQKVHSNLINECLEVMSSALKRDVCNLQKPGCLASEVELSLIKKCLPEHVEYACRYWIRHLQRCHSPRQSGSELRDDGPVHKFLKEHFLHWLEALSLMGQVSEGVLMVTALQSMLTVSDLYCSVRIPDANVAYFQPEKQPNLHAMVHDARRFILNYRSIIEIAPPQVYSSALIFSPKRSVIRNLFSNQVPTWIKNLPVVEDDWSPSLQTLEGHSGSVYTLAFSRDGGLLASGSDDRTVRLWDPATGAALRTIERHSGSVWTLAFSWDGGLLASGSGDCTVRLWDPATGAALRTLEGHSDPVYTLAFSRDGGLLASGSGDRTVRLWDPATGAALRTLEGHSSWVRTLAFSRDGQLTSQPGGSTVQLKTEESVQQTIVSSLSRAQDSFRSSYSLNAMEDWVTWDTQKVLFLPVEYRPGRFAFQDNILAIARPSGRLTFLQFNPDINPQ
jgi:archaellum biogenesis ATPase FlaH